MFTKQDYIHYFEQLGHVERYMLCNISNMLVRLTDPQIKNALQKISEDEIKHYAFVLGVFAWALEPDRVQERRMSAREHSLGTVGIQSLEKENHAPFQGYCVNLSKNGICLESVQTFRAGEHVLMKIKWYNRSDADIERSGKFIWAKEIVPGFFISGVEFDIQ